MRYQELIFIFIFILIALINLIARFVVKKARQTSAAQKSSSSEKSEAIGEPERADTQVMQRGREAEIIEAGKINEMEQKGWRIQREKMRKARLSDVASETDIKQPQVSGSGASEKTGIAPQLVIPSRSSYGEIVKRPIPPDKVEQGEEAGMQGLTADITTIKEVQPSRLEEFTFPELKMEELGRIREGVKDRKALEEKKEISSWQKINKLPYLKKAVVLSEILGKPKSMQQE